MNVKIRLKNARNVFPSKLTKVRREDIISLVDSEYLTEKEKKKMENLPAELNKTNHYEFMAKRSGVIIEFIPLD
jgi:hypothetical protein